MGSPSIVIAISEHEILRVQKIKQTSVRLLLSYHPKYVADLQIIS